MLGGGEEMAHDEPRSPSLTLRVVYEDLPDLIEVEARVVAAGWSGVTRAYTGPPSLVEEARAFGADMIVKGAYTQSRLRQLIFGGVTRYLITSSPVPVMFSH